MIFQSSVPFRNQYLRCVSFFSSIGRRKRKKGGGGGRSAHIHTPIKSV